MKKLKCKKKYGIWYYEKIMSNIYNDIDAPIYELYNDKKEFVVTCGSYYEMFYFIENGEVI